MSFEPGDNVWVHLSPIENVWKQGVVIHNVVGVPDSFIVEINVNSTDEINVILHLALLEVMMVLLKVPLVVNMLRNKRELRTELIDYDQD